MVWDWKDDHPRLPTARSIGALARLVQRKSRTRYVPGFDLVREQFERFCRIAWAMQLRDPGTDLLLVVEELSEVTSPTWAPPLWRRMCNQGRVYGFSIIGTTQAPSYVDKGFSTNATLVRCGRLGEFSHARVIGQRINVKPAQIQALQDCSHGIPHTYVYDGRQTRLEGAAHVT